MLKAECRMLKAIGSMAAMAGLWNHGGKGQHTIIQQTKDDRPFFGLIYTFRFMLSALCLLLSALSSCSFNPNLQGKGQDYLQGEWQQDTSAIQQKLVTISRYHIKFDCDSFYVQISNSSKVNYGSDTCMRLGHWTEYIKGNYAEKNDTLFLKGQYCNANFTLKTNTACFNVGPYKEFFKIAKKTGSLVQLSGTSSVIPVNLQLIKKTNCTQKPL